MHIGNSPALPYLAELKGYMIGAKPDMRRAGNLRDPQNDKVMKKGMHILTSSRYLHGMLEPLKCTGDHEHQPIEGTTRAHGHGVARSTFSERYPRKFARLEAKCLLKKSFPKKLPVGAIMDSALVTLEQWFQISSALAADARMTKRSKVSMPRQLKASSADRSLDTNIRDQTKRMKMNPPTDLSTESQSLETHEKILGEKGKEILEIIEP